MHEPSLVSRPTVSSLYIWRIDYIGLHNGHTGRRSAVATRVAGQLRLRSKVMENKVSQPDNHAGRAQLECVLPCVRTKYR